MLTRSERTVVQLERDLAYLGDNEAKRRADGAAKCEYRADAEDIARRVGSV